MLMRLSLKKVPSQILANFNFDLFLKIKFKNSVALVSDFVLGDFGDFSVF